MSKTDEQPISCSFCGKRESQARLIAGMPVDNPTELSNLICDLMV